MLLRHDIYFAMRAICEEHAARNEQRFRFCHATCLRGATVYGAYVVDAPSSYLSITCFATIEAP